MSSRAAVKKRVGALALVAIALPLAACSAAGGGRSPASRGEAGQGGAGNSGAAGSGGDGGDAGDGGIVAPRRTVEHEGALHSGATWSRAFGGNANCRVYSVAQGKDGSVYAAGLFAGDVDFDAGEGVESRSSFVASAGFLVRYSAEGEFELVRTWSADDANSANGWGNSGLALAVVPGGIVLGGQASGSIAVEGEPVLVEPSGGFSPLLLAFDDEGQLVWSRIWPARRGRVAALTYAGEQLVVSGQFDSEISVAGLPLVPVGDTDCFIGAMSLGGDGLWATSVGSRWNEYFCDSAVSSSVALTGTFYETVNFGPDTLTAQLEDAFLLSLDASGQRGWARSWGSEKLDDGSAVAPFLNGFVVVGDSHGDIDFGVSGSPDVREHISPSSDGYALALDDQGNPLWARTWGVADGGLLPRAVDASGDRIAISGAFSGTFDWGSGAIQSDQTGGSNRDPFVLVLDAEGEPIWFWSAPAQGMDYAHAVAISDSALLFGGDFQGEIDLGTNGDHDVWSSPGLDACYLVKTAVP